MSSTITSRVAFRPSPTNGRRIFSSSAFVGVGTSNGSNSNSKKNDDDDGQQKQQRPARSAYQEAMVLLLVLAGLLGCVSWIQQHRIVLQHDGGAGYSNLDPFMIDDPEHDSNKQRKRGKKRPKKLTLKQEKLEMQEEGAGMLEEQEEYDAKASSVVQRKMAVAQQQQQQQNDMKKKIIDGRNKKKLASAEKAAVDTTTMAKKREDNDVVDARKRVVAAAKERMKAVNERLKNKKDSSDDGDGEGGGIGADTIERVARERGKDQCFVVYHIPKTGGMSLFAHMKHLAKHLGWERVEWYSWYGKRGEADPDPFNDEVDKRRYNYKKIHIGHFTPHFEEKTLTTNCFRITLLREPVDRSISAFYYHKHMTVEWPRCFQFKCRLWWEYINDMTRRFAGHGLKAWNSYQEKKYIAGDREGGGPRPEALDDAKKFLSKFDYLCFLDDLSGCIVDMARDLGLQDFQVEDDHFRNKGERRKEVTD